MEDKYVTKIDQEYIEGKVTEFSQTIRQKLKNVHLTNMDKNLPNLSIKLYDYFNFPGMYMAEPNCLAFLKDLSQYKLSKEELDHMIYHELVHMASGSSPRNLSTLFLPSKLGWRMVLRANYEKYSYYRRND